MRDGPKCTALVELDLLLMCPYLTAYPSASLDEVVIHIINNGGGAYDHQMISRCMAKIELTKKRGSTEAYQAFMPHNILCLQRIWTMPPPVGVFGQQQKKLIDTDECGISLEKTNKGIGHAHTTIQVRKPYTKDTKWTVVICGIEPGDPTLPPNVDGSIQHPRHRFKVNANAGMKQVMFAEFCDFMLTDIETNPTPKGNDDD
jgi:hypothetical protein